MPSRAAARAALHHQIASGAHQTALHNILDLDIVGLYGKTGAHRTVDSQIADKKDVAGVESDILPHIQQAFDRNFVLVVKNIAIGVRQQVIGIGRVHTGIGPDGQFRFVEHKTRVRLALQLFQRDDFGQKLSRDDILRITESVKPLLAVSAVARLQIQIVKIRIEIMSQVVLHHDLWLS